MDAAQLILAFTAGVLALLSPCSLPMLPAYISYYLDRGDQKGRLLNGFSIAVSMITGFLLVFVVTGVILSFMFSELTKWIWVTEPAIGVGLVFLGVLNGWTNIMDGLPWVSLSVDANKLSFLAYGVAYGVASLGCSFPIFVLIVIQGAAAEGLLEMLLLFAAYGAGAAALITPLTLALTLMRGLIYEKLFSILPYIKKINAIVLIAAGAYMIYTGLVH